MVLEIRALAVWRRAHYRSVTEFPHNTELGWLRYILSKHLTSTKCCYAVGPALLMLGQQYSGVGWTSGLSDSLVILMWLINPLSPSRCIKASFYIPENRLHFPPTKGFRTKISMKLVYQYMPIFLYFFTHIKSIPALKGSILPIAMIIIVPRGHDSRVSPHWTFIEIREPLLITCRCYYSISR